MANLLSSGSKLARTPRRRPVARAAIVILAFTTVLGIRISPYPAESAPAYARRTTSSAEEGAAIIWLGIAAIVLVKAFSRREK